MADYKGKYCLINNVLQPVVESSFDQKQEGLSVYEIFRVKDFIPVFLEDHLGRLRNSLELENRKIGETDAEIRGQVQKLIDSNRIQSDKIKLVVNFHQHTYDLWLYFAGYNPPTSDQYLQGVKTIRCRAKRIDPNAKILNTEARRKADVRIRDTDAYEAILVDEIGYITEGSRSNVFFISGKTVVTPPDDRVLPGIARRKIMEICREQNIPLELRLIHQDELTEFDTAFISGTTPKILPVRQLDEMVFSVDNPIMHSLMEAFDAKIDAYIRAHK